MMSFRALLAAAPLLALAVAQNIAFTSTPAEVVAGQSYNITWGGGDGSGVTITLREGDPQDLHTVSTIADAVTNGYYIWTVPSSLVSGDDYAFQITQGQSDINYSGLFSVSGGSASSSISSGSMTASTGAASATMMGNSTAVITSMSGALGTGTAAVRNSTFSSATLSSTDSSTDSSAASSTQDFNSMSTTTHSSATRTPSSASASTSAPSNDAPIRAGSSAALILGIVAAVMLH